MNYAYDSSEQVAKMIELPAHEYPKYGKSTTDPTYYEPAATRIANMKKASGVQLEGIYDFYTKSDVQKFDKENFDENIRNASVDPRYQKGLTREEISQTVNQLGEQAQKVYDNKQSETKAKKERIDEAITASKIVENNSTKEE